MVGKSVGLFVDYENIHISLANKESMPLKHEVLARKLSDIAHARGDVQHLAAWADWDRFPGAQRVFATFRYDTKFVPTSQAGKNSSDMAMQAEVLKLLGSDVSPDTFVIATGDRDLIFMVDELKRTRKEVVLVGVEGTTSMDLKRVAHEFVQLTYSSAPSDTPEQTDKVESAAGGRPTREVLERIRSALEAVLADRRLPWISYRLFSNYLISQDIIAPEMVHRWIERAVEDGYVNREEERGAVKRFCKFSPVQRSEGNAPGLPEPEGGHRPRMPRNTAAHWQDGHAAAQSRSGDSGWNRDWRNFTFVRMVWALREYLIDKPQLSFLTPPMLVEALQKQSIGYSEEEVFFWVNQSVDKGILTREVKESPTAGVQELSQYHLNLQNQLVALAAEVPKAFCQTIQGVLESRPEWNGIAFNLLLKLLQVHPVLSSPRYELPLYRLREWINFLIEEKIFFKFSEPDLRDPTRATTMVALVADNPQSRRFLSQASLGIFFTPEHQALLRTILTIDHFLYWLRTKSPDEDWLPLMTLKSWLRNMLGDQLTKWAIAECERDAIFTIDRFKNKGGAEATVAGVRLEFQHALVKDVIQRRDEFLRILIKMLQNRATIPFGIIEQKLKENDAFGESEAERVGWFPLMVDSKIVTIEKARDDQAGNSICRLNAREKFVGELITRVMRSGSDHSSADKTGAALTINGSLLAPSSRSPQTLSDDSAALPNNHADRPSMTNDGQQPVSDRSPTTGESS